MSLNSPFCPVFLPVDPKGRDPGATKKVKLFHKLQNKVAPAVFNPRMIYDRQKLAYCPAQLSFNGNASGSVSARSAYSSVIWFIYFFRSFSCTLMSTRFPLKRKVLTALY